MIMLSTWQLALLVIVIIAVYSFIGKRDKNGKKYVFPPGPRGLPIVGNSFQLPPFGASALTKRWAAQYGEMFRLRLASTDVVYLNSSRVVSEILEKRSAITSSRPPLPMVSDIVSGGKRMVVMPYNATWRNIRKLMHQVLMSREADKYQPVMERESMQLVWDYYSNPREWFLHNGRYSHSVILSVAFGVRKRKTDAALNELLAASEAFVMELQPGKNLVDGYPILANLPKPLQWWRPRGEKIHQQTCQAFSYFQNEMMAKIENGTAKHCFGRMVNENRKELGFDDKQAMFIGTITPYVFSDSGASVVEAGSDTTRGTLNVVLAAALAQPDWVSRAREQLDLVCGNAQRLPVFADMAKLPYIQAVVKETLRWRPLADVGVHHMCIEDFEFEQYYFPRGTLFTWNAWAISQNPEEYEDPERFWPERYMDEHVGDILHGVWGFGAGRRVCAGYPVAARNLFINTARLLYCFNFEYSGDGKFDVEGRTNFFFPAHLEPFPCNITVRSKAHADLIEREWRETEPELEDALL